MSSDNPKLRNLLERIKQKILKIEGKDNETKEVEKSASAIAKQENITPTNSSSHIASNSENSQNYLDEIKNIIAQEKELENSYTQNNTLSENKETEVEPENLAEKIEEPTENLAEATEVEPDINILAEEEATETEEENNNQHKNELDNNDTYQEDSNDNPQEKSQKINDIFDNLTINHTNTLPTNNHNDDDEDLIFQYVEKPKNIEPTQEKLQDLSSDIDDFSPTKQSDINFTYNDNANNVAIDSTTNLTKNFNEDFDENFINKADFIDTGDINIDEQEENSNSNITTNSKNNTSIEQEHQEDIDFSAKNSKQNIEQDIQTQESPALQEEDFSTTQNQPENIIFDSLEQENLQSNLDTETEESLQDTHQTEEINQNSFNNSQNSLSNNDNPFYSSNLISTITTETMNNSQSMLSEQTINEVNQTLEKLNQTQQAVRKANNITSDENLSQLIKSILEPKLTEWLNTNLSSLVEKIVQEEINKLFLNQNNNKNT
jgi:cell pole-organizing protein PopZ